jgi:hypothetical protein
MKGNETEDGIGKYFSKGKGQKVRTGKRNANRTAIFCFSWH